MADFGGIEGAKKGVRTSSSSSLSPAKVKMKTWMMLRFELAGSRRRTSKFASAWEEEGGGDGVEDEEDGAVATLTLTVGTSRTCTARVSEVTAATATDDDEEDEELFSPLSLAYCCCCCWLLLLLLLS